MAPKFKVGCLLPKKRLASDWFCSFKRYATQCNIEIVCIDIHRPETYRSGLDAILHKFTDLMLGAAPSKNSLCTPNDTQNALMQFEKFLRSVSASRSPPIVLDAVVAMSDLLCRKSMQQRLQNIVEAMHDALVAVPPTVFHENLPADDSAASRDFLAALLPAVCKPLDAATSQNSHKMAIVFDVESLHTVHPTHQLVQKFVEHSGILFKIYVIGNNHWIVPRPSFKLVLEGDARSAKCTCESSSSGSDDAENFHIITVSRQPAQTPTPPVFFDTLQLKREFVDADAEETAFGRINYALVDKLVDCFRAELRLGLFGFDVLVDKWTGRHYLIDVNYFPGYSGVPDSEMHIANYILHCLSGMH